MLNMYPYPSASRLHVGHGRNYILGDALYRRERMAGRKALNPMGWDAFGLPAENAAIQSGVHPREYTLANIARMKEQLRSLGLLYDWSKELASCDPSYYRWNQWLFLRMWEHGLAYRKTAPVNWCPGCRTVLANEQVVNGRCERSDDLVEIRDLTQWFFRVTDYAERLLAGLDGLSDWPERVKTMQRNWIGRSEGAEILFRIEELDEDIPVFTTRPDTLFGATFFVLAPEHPLVPQLAAGSEHEAEVLAYVRRTAATRGAERADPDREKTGVFTGRYAINPVNDEKIPVWVADYVLMEYGTGAIMAVPAHDERDFEFAQRHDLPVRTVVVPADGEDVEREGAFVAHSENEVLVESGEFSGLPSPEAKRAIVEWLRKKGRGAPAVRFRLRDWGFSRQRYWGSPIPVIHCDECGIVPVPEDELPVLLPDVEDYRPRGKPPLASNEEWLRAPCPRCGREGRREAETMDTFVDSSWYFLRYCDPRNDQAPFDRRIVDFWMPINQYVGGIDHATGHLLYSRYFTKVLNDLGLVGFREPFARLFHQGWVQFDGTKMSKSKGNVVGPDDLIEQYGADAVRLYILFLGPADQDMAWTESGIEGIVRFLQRFWRTVNDAAAGDPGANGSPLARKAHETIAKVTDDIERRWAFNTPIAAIMELTNEISRNPDDPARRFAAETAVSLIQPYAPHIAEELWGRLGHERLWKRPWPKADPALLERDTFELVIQVNGKVRDRVEVAVDTPERELIELAKASSRVQAHLDGKEIRQTIVVPRKLVNLVVG